MVPERRAGARTRAGAREPSPGLPGGGQGWNALDHAATRAACTPETGWRTRACMPPPAGATRSGTVAVALTAAPAAYTLWCKVHCAAKPRPRDAAGRESPDSDDATAPRGPASSGARSRRGARLALALGHREKPV